MSRLPFLDNVYPGENNFWRYFFTIILIWGAPIILGIMISIFFMTYLLTQGFDASYLVENFTSNPLIFMLFIAITYVISFFFLYIGVRYIHQRKFMSLVTTESRFNWKRFWKGGLASFPYLWQPNTEHSIKKRGFGTKRLRRQNGGQDFFLSCKCL